MKTIQQNANSLGYLMWKKKKREIRKRASRKREKRKKEKAKQKTRPDNDRGRALFLGGIIKPCRIIKNTLFTFWENNFKINCLKKSGISLMAE